MWQKIPDMVLTIVRNSGRISRPTVGIIRQLGSKSIVNTLNKVASLKPLAVLTLQLSYAGCHLVGASIVLLFVLNASALAPALVLEEDLMSVLVQTCWIQTF